MYWLGVVGFMVFFASTYLMLRIKPVESALLSALGVFIGVIGMNMAWIQREYYYAQVVNETTNKTLIIQAQEMDALGYIGFIATILNTVILFISLILLIYKAIYNKTFKPLRPLR